MFDLLWPEKFGSICEIHVRGDAAASAFHIYYNNQPCLGDKKGQGDTSIGNWGEKTFWPTLLLLIFCNIQTDILMRFFKCF